MTIAGTVLRALFLAGFALATIPVFLGFLNPDLSWLLHIAERVLNGAVLYDEIIEVNPPLIVWLNMLPVLAARLVGCSPVLAFRVLMLGTVAGSLALCGRVLRHAFPEERTLRRVLLVLLLFALLPMAKFDFGQREHLMLALVLPYVLAAAARLAGRPVPPGQAWLVGLLAGVGFALKPYFVPTWLLIEGYLLWVRRGEKTWRRPECAAVLLVGLLYAAAVLALAPEYLDVIIRFREGYTAFCKSALTTVFLNGATMMAAWSVFGLLFVRPVGATQAITRALLLAVLGLLAALIVQRKAFPYHIYPVLATGFLIVGLLAWEARQRSFGFSARLVAWSLGLVTLWVAGSSVVWEARFALTWKGQADEIATAVGDLTRLVREHAPGENVYVLCDDNYPSFPMVTYSGAKWPFRFSSLWLLAGLYADAPDVAGAVVYHSTERTNPTERYLIDAIVADLRQARPTLLIVDARPSKPGFRDRYFDYLEYFARDRRFAELFAEYEFFTSVDDFAVYRRRPDLTAARALSP